MAALFADSLYLFFFAILTLIHYSIGDPKTIINFVCKSQIVIDSSLAAVLKQKKRDPLEFAATLVEDTNRILAKFENSFIDVDKYEYFYQIQLANTVVLDTNCNASPLSCIDGDDINNFLETFARAKTLSYNKFCMNFLLLDQLTVFSDKDMSYGFTRGLSFTPMLNKETPAQLIAPGGLCSRGTINGLAVNTAVINTYDFAKLWPAGGIRHPPPNETLAHEFLHSGGSQHDEDDEFELSNVHHIFARSCSSKNYLMSTTTNNRIQEISWCTKYRLQQMLDWQIAQGRFAQKPNCLTRVMVPPETPQRRLRRERALLTKTGTFNIISKNVNRMDRSAEVHVTVLYRPSESRGTANISNLNNKTGCTDEGGAPLSHYVVEKQDLATGRWVPAGEGNDTHIELNHLQSAVHEYKFRVKAVGRQYGESNPLKALKSVLAKDPYKTADPSKKGASFEKYVMEKRVDNEKLKYAMEMTVSQTDAKHDRKFTVESSANINLNFLGCEERMPPTFMDKSRILPFDGEALMILMECKVNTSSRPTIKWIKDGTPLTVGGLKRDVFADLDNGTYLCQLEIRRLAAGVEGHYRCNIRN